MESSEDDIESLINSFRRLNLRETLDAGAERLHPPGQTELVIRTRLEREKSLPSSNTPQSKGADLPGKSSQVESEKTSQPVPRQLPKWFPRDKNIYHGMFIPPQNPKLQWIAPGYPLRPKRSSTDEPQLTTYFNSTPVGFQNIATGLGNPKPLKPATEFTLFSKLPVDLRLIIWRAALPTGQDRNGSLVYSMTCYPSGSTVGMDANLRPIQPQLGYTGIKAGRSIMFAPIQGQSVQGHPRRTWQLLLNSSLNGYWTSEEAFDIGVARVCHESREVYLRRFKYTLPELRWSDRVVRYDEDAIIHISNAFYLKRWIHDATLLNYQMPDICSNVQHLSVDTTILDFVPNNRMNPFFANLFLRGDGSETICQFKRLKTLTIWGDILAPSSRRLNRLVKRLELGLREYQRSVDPSYQVPVILWMG